MHSWFVPTLKKIVLDTGSKQTQATLDQAERLLGELTGAMQRNDRVIDLALDDFTASIPLKEAGPVRERLAGAIADYLQAVGRPVAEASAAEKIAELQARITALETENADLQSQLATANALLDEVEGKAAAKGKK